MNRTDADGEAFICASQQLVASPMRTEERTSAWLTGFRGRAIYYEFARRSHEAWLLTANRDMCLNGLEPT